MTQPLGPEPHRNQRDQNYSDDVAALTFGNELDDWALSKAPKTPASTTRTPKAKPPRTATDAVVDCVKTIAALVAICFIVYMAYAH